jgi:hypothetical protein
MNAAISLRSGGTAYKQTTPEETDGRAKHRRLSMALSRFSRSFGKVAVAAAGLTLATLATAAPAAAQGWGGARFETVQYYGGHGHGHGHGWRRHHRGPRCYIERVVRHTHHGRRVFEHRVCR